MSIPLTQDFNGQLSLFGTNENSLIVVSPYSVLIDTISKGIKSFQSEISKYRLLEDSNQSLEDTRLQLEERFDNFIDYFIEQFNGVSLDEVVEHYEDDASEWHKLNKVLLFYLKNYVYNKGLVKTLDDPRASILESVISLDQIRFREEYYKSILEEMNRRKKARVENYIIYDGNDFLEEVNELIKSRGENMASYSIAPRVQELVSKKNFLEDLFLSKIELDDENTRGILAMLFLHYLRECIYNDPRNANINKFIENIEFFVVVNYSPKFLLSKRQKEAYQTALNNVSKRMINYVEKNSAPLFKAIKDYDLIENRKKNHRLLMFEQTEDLKDFPEPHTSNEIKSMLETFINSVFLPKLRLPSDNLPIFCEDAKEARIEAMKLTLVYLGRYAYKEKMGANEELIWQLEDYIYDDKDFSLDQNDMGELFSTKSTMLSRVGVRRVKQSYGNDQKQLSLN